MFLLSGSDFPNNEASLIAAIGNGLRPLGLNPERVSTEGAFPSLAALRCEISGAVFLREHRAAKAVGELKPGFFARRVEVACRSAQFEGLAFAGSLSLDDAIFAFGRDAASNPVLALEKCASGALELAVERSEFEKLVHSLASKAAEEHGAEVKSVTVSWEQSGPRALSMRLVARAKAMFMETSVTALGRVEVTDSLDVIIAGLSCSGDGMVGNLAASFLRKEIPKYEGRSISLAGAFGGGLRLRDVALQCEQDSLRVKASALPVGT